MTDHNDMIDEDFIDLGAVVEMTTGGGFIPSDTLGQLQVGLGLCDD